MFVFYFKAFLMLELFSHINIIFQIKKIICIQLIGLNSQIYFCSLKNYKTKKKTIRQSKCIIWYFYNSIMYPCFFKKRIRIMGPDCCVETWFGYLSPVWHFSKLLKFHLSLFNHTCTYLVWLQIKWIHSKAFINVQHKWLYECLQ